MNEVARPGRARPRPFPGPLAAVALTLVAQLAFVVSIRALDGLSTMPAVGIAQVIGLGGVAALATLRVPDPHAGRIGLVGVAPRFVLPLLCLLPLVVVISEIGNYTEIILPTDPALTDQLDKIVRADSAYAAVQQTLVAVGISPVVEGFFFFGVLLQGLVARLGRAGGVLFTAVLYAVVHFPASGATGDAIVPAASALMTGALFGLARLATGSVLAAMALAAGFAAIHLISSEGASYLPIPGYNAPGEHTPALVVLPCLAVGLYGIWSLWRTGSVVDTNPPLPAAHEIEEDEDAGFFF